MSSEPLHTCWRELHIERLSINALPVSQLNQCSRYNASITTVASSIIAMTASSPDPGDNVKPHPEDTVETILKAMEKKPDNFQMDGQTRLSDIGFVKEDFGNFVMYYWYLIKPCNSNVDRYCKNAFNVEPTFDRSTQERLAQSGTVKDLEEKVIEAVKHSKKGSVGDS